MTRQAPASEGAFEHQEPTRGRDPRAGRRPALVFDGDCGFCTAAVDWLRPRLAEEVWIVPSQRADLAAAGISREEADRTVWWLTPGGERLHSERAVAQALLACRAPVWRRLGLLLLAPGVRPLAAVGYRAVARWRGHLPGTTPACARSSAAIPSEEGRGEPGDRTHGSPP